MDWTEIVVSVDADKIEQASDIAQMVVPDGIYIEDYRNLEREAMEITHVDLIDENLLKKDRAKGLIHVYISPEENPAEAVAFLSERYNAEKIRHEITTSLCRNEDWENNWKAYFKPVPLGEHLLIRPTWEDEYDAGTRTVMHIDPGLAFGTGTHHSTRLCMEALEPHIAPGKTVLDIGCGSGILSIAALLLGAESAVAVDIDSLAVKTARENAQINNIGEDRYTVLEGNLTDKVSGQFDIVVANIVADVIILFCENVAKYMKPGAVFITSGIIDIREGDMLAAFEKYGFRVEKRHKSSNWVCFECRLKQ